MNFYIRELPDGKATLMTHDGLYLFTFRDLASARQACEEWYRSNDYEIGEIAGMSGMAVSCSVCT